MKIFDTRILTNSEKSLILNNFNIEDLEIHIDGTFASAPDILKINRLDYLLDYEISTMPSAKYLEKNYKDKILETMKKRSDRNDNHNIIDLFIQSDPTTNRKYVVWLIKSYLRGGIKKIEDLLSRARPALESFIILTKNKKLTFSDPSKPWTNEKDINNYFGLVPGVEKGREKMGLENIIDKYSDFLETKIKKKEIEESVKDDLEIYYENDLVKVYHPLTEAASCLIGRGTKWCTAADKDNMFEEYDKKGPLYVIIPKNPKYPGEKYQYHHETDSYMDEKDEEIQEPWRLFRRLGMEFELQNVLISIDNIKELEDLQDDIKKLNLTKLKLKKIPDLSRFYTLEKLVINNSNIEKIENVENLVTLKDIILFNNHIRKIENVEALINLKIFNLGRNEIEKIENLDKLINLKTLYLGDNKINKIENLENLVNLENLILVSNNIRKIENVESLKNLKFFNLGGNKISKIENMDNLTSLEDLSLQYNQIKILENIENLSSIEYISLEGNDIYYIDNGKYLENLEKLKNINLEDNQIKDYDPSYQEIPENIKKKIYL